MKKYTKLIAKVFALLIFLSMPLLSAAQASPDANQRKEILKVVDSIFNRGFKNGIVKDSIGLYVINFDLDIVKNKNGTEVRRVGVNDELGYSLFPSYKKLYSINYNSLMGSKKRITLRIPVLVVNSGIEKRIYRKEDGSPLIDLKAAYNAAYALISNVPYDNRKQAGMEYQLQSYYVRNPKTARFKDIVLLNPYFIEIVNIK
uniref:hypothetical protein n=1 Tax=Pedobacter schmidteae TaxID=2201271 RepID=UPI000EB00EF6|nr:hypothetical protein [Pedobacter schmidteae]